MRLKSLDALRGFAASWVVFYHLWNRYYPGMNTQGQAFQLPDVITADFLITFPVFQFGYIGITLFFVLSGFCIHLPQARNFSRSQSDSLSLRDFGRRRFWRLYPAYVASIIFSALALGIFPIVLAVVKQQGGNWVEIFSLKHALFNAAFLQQFFPGSLEFNGVYWTLLFEVQFYLFYPVLLSAARRFGFNKLLWALLAAELLLIFRPPLIQHFFLSRYYEWYLGMLAAEWYVQGRCPVPAKTLAMGGIAGGIASTFFLPFWPFRDVLLSTGFFGLLLFVVQVEAGSLKVRTIIQPWKSKVLIMIGIYSYSLYLVHVPVLDLTWKSTQLAVKYGFLPISLAPWVAFLGVPAAFVLGYFFYKVFERPFMPATVKIVSVSPQAKLPTKAF